MSVEFNEEEPVMTRQKPQKLSLFTRLVYKLKLANTEAGAQQVMLIAALCCLGATVLLFLNLAGVI